MNIENITEQQIIDASIELGRLNQNVKSEILQFMRESAIEKLEKINIDNQIINEFNKNKLNNSC